MAMWLVRAGRDGEHEDHFIAAQCINLTWGERVASTDLATAKDFEGIKRILAGFYANETAKWISHSAGQFWPFLLGMQVGDLVVMPRKRQAAIAIAEVTGAYCFAKEAPLEYRHMRPVRWLQTELPRTRFDQDLLHSFGAFMTICEIKRNDAEKRVRGMLGFKTSDAAGVSMADVGSPTLPDTELSNERDLQRESLDQIARLIERRFAGHRMAVLVEGILNAMGYQTYLSPPGPDGGVDILAGTAPMGFGSLRLCVQVKSGDTPVDRPTLDQLLGTMQNFSASQGLLVSWGGFKQSVGKVEAQQFFKVRLWDADALIEQILQHYELLPPSLKAELNLMRIWVPAAESLE